MKRPDEEQRMREEREAERRGRDRDLLARRPRLDLAGRDALRITMVERTAIAAEDEPPDAPDPAAGEPPDAPDPAAGERIDLDMRPRDIGAANRWRAYTMGWRVGARGATPDPKATGHADRGIATAYQAGYDDGCRAFSAAAQYATDRYDHTPSVLRAGGAAAAPDQVITEGGVAAALTVGAREREQAERALGRRPRGGRR